MKFSTRLAAGIAAAAALAGATGASAAVLYDNGPSTYENNAWFIDTFSVAEFLDLSSSSSVTGVTFVSWLAPGDTTVSLDWSVLNGAPGVGSVIASGIAAVTQGATLVSNNNDGYNVYQDSFSIPSQSLSAGAYWLELTGATNKNGGRTGWDENDGPSQAQESVVGSIGSESFQILGTTATVPEPSSWALMMLGVGLLGAALRGNAVAARRLATLQSTAV